jgi:hypothetical protein
MEYTSGYELHLACTSFTLSINAQVFEPHYVEEDDA